MTSHERNNSSSEEEDNGENEVEVVSAHIKRIHRCKICQKVCRSVFEFLSHFKSEHKNQNDSTPTAHTHIPPAVEQEQGNPEIMEARSRGSDEQSTESTEGRTPMAAGNDKMISREGTSKNAGDTEPSSSDRPQLPEIHRTPVLPKSPPTTQADSPGTRKKVPESSSLMYAGSAEDISPGGTSNIEPPPPPSSSSSDRHHPPQTVNEESPTTSSNTSSYSKFHCLNCPETFSTIELLKEHAIKFHIFPFPLADAPKARRNARGRRKSLSPRKRSAKVYCVCKQKYDRAMVCCDNKHCKIKWYHFDCVRITSAPEGKWYCPFCCEPSFSASDYRLASK